MKQNRKSPLITLTKEDMYIHPRNVGVMEGYAPSKNFPNCCSFHSKAYELVQEWFDKFPDCCERHQKFMEKFGFEKAQFKNVPLKVMGQLSFTEYHISKRVGIPDWLEDITQYIEWHFGSFGQPEVGFEWYWKILKYFVQQYKPNRYNTLWDEEVNDFEPHCIENFNLPEEKRQKLLAWFEAVSTPVEEQQEDKDLDLLYNTFQDWVDTFPDLEFFRELKEAHVGKIPVNLFLYNPVHNRYSGLTKFETRSQTELLEVLVAITKQILDEIDTASLIEAGVITNANEYKYKLIRESHRLKQAQLFGNFTEGEQSYRQILEVWVANEKAYFIEIEPLFNKVPQLSSPASKMLQTDPLSRKLSHTQIALVYRYLVQAGLEKPITVECRDEIARHFGWSSPTSGQKIYDWFNKLNTPNQRTSQGKNKIKDLEAAICYLKKYPPAKALAENELKMAKRNNP